MVTHAANILYNRAIISSMYILKYKKTTVPESNKIYNIMENFY